MANNKKEQRHTSTGGVPHFYSSCIKYLNCHLRHIMKMGFPHSFKRKEIVYMPFRTQRQYSGLEYCPMNVYSNPPSTIADYGEYHRAEELCRDEQNLCRENDCPSPSHCSCHHEHHEHDKYDKYDEYDEHQNCNIQPSTSCCHNTARINNTTANHSSCLGLLAIAAALIVIHTVK